MEKPDNDNLENTTIREAELVPSNEAQELKASIFNKIETEAVKPKAKWLCFVSEYAIWLLWVLTILLGALSVAVTLFVFSEQRYALYELTHPDLITFVMEVMPTLWLVLFGTMVVLAVFNLRHTKRGYRYRLWQIIGSSMILSLALGALLHIAGVGFSLDNQIGRMSSSYLSQEKMEMRWWQNPEEGRLIGMAMSVRESGATDVRFIDMSGVAWQVELDELEELEQDLLLKGDKVRVFGQTKDMTIHACGIMPWGHEKNGLSDDPGEIRRGAREKIDSFRAERDTELATSTACREMLRVLHRPLVGSR